MHIFNLIRKDNWPLYIATAALLIPVLILGRHLLQDTGGAYSLPRDEAFLQLSTAKTLAFRQIWGIDRQHFVAASPSLLYPLVLAVTFFLFGANLILVPIINTAIAVILLTVIHRWLVKRGVTALNQLFILLAVIILTPLPVMAIYGMESPLLLLFAFLFVSRLSDEWTLPEFSRRTMIYGALMVAARYDGAILIAAACLFLLWRRKWLTAFELALWSLLPALVFGIIAIFKGSYFLPNVFMVEGAGSLLSYDWLVGCGAAVAVPWLSGYLAKWPDRKAGRAAGTAILLIALILTARNLYAFRASERSSLGTYRIKYPIAQFAHRYYYRYGIVSDDVGMISFETDGRYLDLSGLASIKIARSRLANFFSPELIHELSREQNSQIAIISDTYDKPLPDHWIRTGQWQIPDPDPSEKRAVSFYAMDSSAATRLRKNLEEYTHFLPQDLTVQYFYSPPPEKKDP